MSTLRAAAATRLQHASSSVYLSEPVQPANRFQLFGLQGVTCVAYRPLGHGKEGLLTHPEIGTIAEEVGKSTAQVLTARHGFRKAVNKTKQLSVVIACYEAVTWLAMNGCPELPRFTLPDATNLVFVFGLLHKSVALRYISKLVLVPSSLTPVLNKMLVNAHDSDPGAVGIRILKAQRRGHDDTGAAEVERPARRGCDTEGLVAGAHAGQHRGPVRLAAQLRPEGASGRLLSVACSSADAPNRALLRVTRWKRAGTASKWSHKPTSQCRVFVVPAFNVADANQSSRARAARRVRYARCLGADEWWMHPQARIDKLDEGKRFVDPEWHDWGDPEEGGAAKASRVILS